MTQTEGRACDDTGRRQTSTCQGERPLKEPTRLTPWSPTFSLQNCEKVNFCCVRFPSRGLPWWRSGGESACQCRGCGFEPWSGKIPHATEQLGSWATTTEPARLEPVLRNKRGRDSERPVHRDEEWPPLAATRESPRTETKTQHRKKKIN